MSTLTFRPKRAAQLLLLVIAVFAFMGVSDEDARFRDLGHRMMCVCSCSQVLLECNHVGCMYSERMRGELAAAIDRGDNDDLTLQSFIQKYGTTVIAAPSTKGFGRVAWVMPFVVLVGGVAMVVLVVRSWRNGPPPPPAGGVKPLHGPELERYRDQADKELDL
jgi:cytochrome c-type biogenesis protein CcmH/NrfF